MDEQKVKDLITQRDGLIAQIADIDADLASMVIAEHASPNSKYGRPKGSKNKPRVEVVNQNN